MPLGLYGRCLVFLYDVFCVPWFKYQVLHSGLYEDTSIEFFIVLYGVIVYLGLSFRHYTLCYIVTRGFSAKKNKAFDSLIKGCVDPS